MNNGNVFENKTFGRTDGRKTTCACMYLLLELCARYDGCDSVTASDLIVGTEANNGNVVCNKDSSKNGKCPKQLESNI
jgi:hypothetical protein